MEEVVLHTHPVSLSLSNTVCSYGFYMIAPNVWLPAEVGGKSALERPLRLLDGKCAMVSVSKTHDSSELQINVKGVSELDEADRDNILKQVNRMLRISEEEDRNVEGFHATHPRAKEENFGRLFRSPTLFEDMIKSLLLCNCGWSRTISMAKSLCEFQAELKGPPLGHEIFPEKRDGTDILGPNTPPPKEVNTTRRKRNCSIIGLRSRKKLQLEKVEKSVPTAVSTVAEEEECEETVNSSVASSVVGAFPSPEELANVDPAVLAKRCGVGYRAKSIVKLARDVCTGEIVLENLEKLRGQELKKHLLQLHGFGPFVCTNVMTCMGEYSSVPCDSETVRHLKDIHGLNNCNKKNVVEEAQNLYAKYAPFQFLAYWWELWRAYEKRFGDLSKMPSCDYRHITGWNMSRTCKR